MLPFLEIGAYGHDAGPVSIGSENPGNGTCLASNIPEFKFCDANAIFKHLGIMGTAMLMIMAVTMTVTVTVPVVMMVMMFCASN